LGGPAPATGGGQGRLSSEANECLGPVAIREDLNGRAPRNPQTQQPPPPHALVKERERGVSRIRLAGNRRGRRGWGRKKTPESGAVVHSKEPRESGLQEVFGNDFVVNQDGEGTSGTQHGLFQVGHELEQSLGRSGGCERLFKAVSWLMENLEKRAGPGKRHNRLGVKKNCCKNLKEERLLEKPSKEEPPGSLGRVVGRVGACKSTREV